MTATKPKAKAKAKPKKQPYILLGETYLSDGVWAFMEVTRGNKIHCDSMAYRLGGTGQYKQFKVVKRTDYEPYDDIDDPE